MGLIFKPFPVKMKVLRVDAGRVSNPATASCAATYTLETLIARSFSKVSRRKLVGCAEGARRG
jgi:hypothetical protein